jgi:hypothetical protein
MFSFIFQFNQGNAKTFFQPPASHSRMFRCDLHHLWRTCPCFNFFRNRRMALCEVVSIHILSDDVSFVYWKHLHDSGNHCWKVHLHKYHSFITISVSPPENMYLNTNISCIYRYVAVCKPHRYRELNLRVNAIRRVMIYTIPVISFSILLNIPKFFETQVTFFISRCIQI